MRNYIGLDAHSKTCTFVVVDGKGRQTGYQKIKTGEKEILNFLDSVKGTKALTFEESNLSKWLYTVLKDNVDKLLICDPAVISRRKGPKDDYPDTLHLAQQLRGDFLVPVFHEDNFFSELRSVVSAYDDLITDISHNTISNSGHAGIHIGYQAGDMVVRGNTITNAGSDGAILIARGETYIGPISVTENTLNGNVNGIVIPSSSDLSGKDISVSSNTISGNSTTGILHRGSGILNAIQNYWGDCSGPKLSSNPDGKGDAILSDGDNVNYSPYLSRK